MSTVPPQNADLATFTRALESGRWDEVLSILEQGIDLEHCVAPAFYTATNQGATPVVRWFLEAGMDPNADNGRAIVSASMRGHAETVKLLLEYGADPHRHDEIALRNAASNGHVAVARILLAHGARLHAKDDDALIVAVINRNVAMVDLLLDHGADIHARKDTPLRMAAKNSSSPELVGRLLARGADPQLAEAMLKDGSGYDESVRSAIRAFQLHQKLNQAIAEAEAVTPAAEGVSGQTQTRPALRRIGGGDPITESAPRPRAQVL